MELVAGLILLALLDSTSVGTLVIPVWLLLSPRRPPSSRVAGYLAAIAGYYFAVGLVLLLALGAGAAALASMSMQPLLLWAQLVVGVGLFALSWRYDSGRRRRRGEPDRTIRWRDRVLDTEYGHAGLLRLAVLAGSVELLTMLPYLAALGLITAADLNRQQQLALLGGYCLVMVLPALVFTAVRAVATARIEPLLVRVDNFLHRHADSALGWVMGIAGFLIARDAAARLWWLDRM